MADDTPTKKIQQQQLKNRADMKLVIKKGTCAQTHARTHTIEMRGQRKQKNTFKMQTKTETVVRADECEL